MAEEKAKLEEDKRKIEEELTKLTADISQLEETLAEGTLSASQEELKKADLANLNATKQEREDTVKNIEAQLAAIGDVILKEEAPEVGEGSKTEQGSKTKPEEIPLEAKPNKATSNDEVLRRLREEKRRLESVKKGKQQSSKTKVAEEERKIKETMEELGTLQRDGYLSKSDVNIETLETKMDRKRNSLQKEAKMEETEIKDIDIEIKRIDDLLKVAGSPDSEANMREWEEKQLQENRKRWRVVPGSWDSKTDPITAPVLVGGAQKDGALDPAVLEQLKAEEAKAAKINKEIAVLKEELAQYAKKDKMSDEDIKNMRKKQDILMEKMKEFAEITKNVQNLMGLAKVTSSQLGPPQKPMIPTTEEKTYPTGGFRPQDTLPKVIICGSGGEDQVPKIIICEPTTKNAEMRSKSQEDCLKAREQKLQNCQQPCKGMSRRSPNECQDMGSNQGRGRGYFLPGELGPQVLPPSMMGPGMTQGMPSAMLPGMMGQGMPFCPYNQRPQMFSPSMMGPGIASPPMMGPGIPPPSSYGMMSPGMQGYPPSMMAPGIPQGMMLPGMPPGMSFCPGEQLPQAAPPPQSQPTHPPPTLPSNRTKHAKLILTGNGPVLLCFPAEKKRKKDKTIDPPCPHYFPCVRDLCDSGQKQKTPNPTKMMALKALCQLNCGESKKERSQKKPKDCFCHSYGVEEPCE